MNPSSAASQTSVSLRQKIGSRLKATENLLSRADGLNKVLFEQRAKTAPQVRLPLWLSPQPSSNLQPIGGPR